MSKRKSTKVLVIDAFLLAFWLIILLIELLFIQDIIWTIIVLIGVFIFSALLGRDMRKRG